MSNVSIVESLWLISISLSLWSMVELVWILPDLRSREVVMCLECQTQKGCFLFRNSIIQRKCCTPPSSSFHFHFGSFEIFAPTMSAPPKRDKFAALAAQQKQPQAAVAAAAAAAAPPTATSVPSAASTSASASAGPKRADKFASLQNATAIATTVRKNRGDKFAAVQQQKKVAERQNKQQELLDKCRQRDQVWNDLDTAEASVIRLLQLAEQTTSLLAQQSLEPITASSDADMDTDADSIMSRLEGLQSQYQQTVHQVHSLLAPHAEFVKAYEKGGTTASTAAAAAAAASTTGTSTSNINPMYLQRVELRLADSKVRLLEKLHDNLKGNNSTNDSQPQLPTEAITSLDDGKKRKLEST
jgi:hypothetical protein